ncbi:hypothetical protein C8R47DRAFT_1056068 [Mycena vitilis]|nr:hypothetical protein C8R47DRAFT_1056068 [Mycena vitilis]
MFSKPPRKKPGVARRRVAQATVHSGADLNEVEHHSVSTAGRSVSTSYTLPSNTAVVMKPDEAQVPLPPTLPPKRTQTSVVLEEMRKKEPYLQERILSHEANPLFGRPCECGREGHLCEVTCHNCTQYRPSCKGCFMDYHRYNPFHWAEVWDVEKGFLVRHDISRLVPNPGYYFSLGHYGRPCDVPTHATPFTVVDCTGIHATSVRFCKHGNAPQKVGDDKVAQLLDARLFPCTMLDPKSAITFECLKTFQMLSLEATTAAYNYVGALCLLTDNSFVETVPDMYENFVRVAHEWGYLTMKKRLGQELGIDTVIPNRPKGNLVLYCPSCPEPGFNNDPKMGPLPPHMRHLNQQRTTLDGNFHCNKATKNTDPTDTSLYRGQSYFPSDEFLKEQVKKGSAAEPKSTCSYLKAVNNQDKKKFKNMDVTGIVNTQCSHVFVKASVDLQYGERYVNVDISLAHALRQKLAMYKANDTPGVDQEVEVEIQLACEVDEILSYDAMCQYSAYIEERFAVDEYKDLLPIIKRMRFSIPFLHVQGHQDGCMYRYSTAYMLATTHFHGETAEHYWPKLNQIGPQTRQMNGGHRQDTVINHHSHWNYTKMAKSVALLIHQLKTADELFALHLSQFMGLTETYASRIREEKWLEKDREPDFSRGMKNIVSVYKYNSSKVPTQTAIYQKMLKDETPMVNSETAKSKAASFINEGVKIQELQLKVRLAVASEKEHPLASTGKSITTLRANLKTRLAKFRKTQSVLTPLVVDALSNDARCEVEIERLGLPSDFADAEERGRLNLLGLSQIEGSLREGAAFDAIHSIQVLAKALVAMSDRKRKNDSGVAKNTISQTQINDTIDRRDARIQNYMAARRAMMALGVADGSAENFPPLRAEDTYMKSRNKRTLGASRKTDLVWTQSGARAVPRLPSDSAARPAAAAAADLEGTTMSRRKTATTKKKRRDDGWIWRIRKMGKMTEQELDKWVKDGDEVQWHRSEADMRRWQEEGEAKLAELRTTIRSFDAYKVAFTQMANQQDVQKQGHIAYAKQKAWMFGRRAELGRKALLAMPKYAVLADGDADLLAFVNAEREVHEVTFRGILDAEKARQQAWSHPQGGAGAEEWEDAESDEDEDEDETEDDGLYVNTPFPLAS